MRFASGELFVYVNGDRWELGMVKRPNNTGDGYFCWYSRGDTAANTPTDRMRKLANAGFTHVEELLDQLRGLARQAHECKTDGGSCEDCYQDEGCCPIERDMRGLGLEE